MIQAKPKTEKVATIEAFLPEMRGKLINLTARGRGSNARLATASAFKSLFLELKGRRFQTIKATITIVQGAVQEAQ